MKRKSCGMAGASPSRKVQKPWDSTWSDAWNEEFYFLSEGCLYIPIIGKGCRYYYWVDMTINWDDEGQSLSETFYFLRRTLGHMNADEILDEHLKLSIWTQRIDSSLAFGLKRWQM